MEEYSRYLLGGCPTAKHRENVRSAVARIKLFIRYMAHGRCQLSTWLFMDDIGRVQRWPYKLMEEGRTVTTARVYLQNLSVFLQYFAETSPQASRLSRIQQTGILRTVKNCVQQLRKDVVLHRITTKEAKLAHVVSAPTLVKCQDVARTRIPQLLDMMEEEDDSLHLRHLFYGYFCALVASLYGHRTGVLTGMTVAQVEAARAGDHTESLGFLVNVSWELLAPRAVNPAECGGELTDLHVSSAGQGAQNEPGLRYGAGVPDGRGVLLGGAVADEEGCPQPPRGQIPVHREQQPGENSPELPQDGVGRNAPPRAHTFVHGHTDVRVKPRQERPQHPGSPQAGPIHVPRHLHC